ncbi:MAG: DUF4386 family protein, partial [Solirubrobacteraceae bacterium]
MAAEELAEPPPEDPEAIAAREDRERPRAVGAALLAAAVPLLGAVYGLLSLGDVPTGDRGRLLFLDEHGTDFIIAAVLIALGALATGVTLLFLYRATKSRRPELPMVARVCAIAGPILLLAASIAAQVVLASKARDFATSGLQTAAAAKEVFRSGAYQGPLYASFAGQVAIAFAVILISLNAMRAGLLTRFLGVLGIIAGVLFVIPLGSPLPIVQSFWFGALALLFSGRWPQGMPPAWASGEAVPWPSQQEIRELRERESERSEPASESESGRDPDPEPAA